MAETLGSLLRKKRESLGLTLEKVEGFTHIRAKHLQAIESDDLSTIPSVPQARGFIRNYASFLGINPDDIAGQVGATRPRPAKSPAEKSSPDISTAAPPPAASQAATLPPPAQPPLPAGSTRPRAPITAPVISRSAAYAQNRPLPATARGRSWLRMDRILGGAVTLMVIALLGWGGYHIVLSVRGSSTPTLTEPFIPLSSESPGTAVPADLTAQGTGAPAGSELAPSGTGELTPAATVSGSAITPGTLSVATLSPTPFPTPLGGVYTDVRIHLIVVQRAFLEVEVDGKAAFSGRVQPGETYDYVGRKTVTLSTGNGAGIQVIFNGVNEGTMGRFGEVVSQTYTPTGIITPVPEPTATPTITPTPTNTKNP
jgi:cytoskeleton protein RodZ